MDLKQLSEAYVDYLNKVGDSAPSQIHTDQFPPIWDSSCQKIMNGVSLYQGGEFFLSQMREVVEFAGKFQINLLDVIVGDQTNMSSIRYDLQSERAGAFQTSAFLTFNDKGFLTEINEVCSQRPPPRL